MEALCVSDVVILEVSMNHCGRPRKEQSDLVITNNKIAVQMFKLCGWYFAYNIFRCSPALGLRTCACFSSQPSLSLNWGWFKRWLVARGLLSKRPQYKRKSWFMHLLNCCCCCCCFCLVVWPFAWHVINPLWSDIGYECIFRLMKVRNRFETPFGIDLLVSVGRSF